MLTPRVNGGGSATGSAPAGPGSSSGDVGSTPIRRHTPCDIVTTRKGFRCDTHGIDLEVTDRNAHEPCPKGEEA